MDRGTKPVSYPRHIACLICKHTRKLTKTSITREQRQLYVAAVNDKKTSHVAAFHI